MYSKSLTFLVLGLLLLCNCVSSSGLQRGNWKQIPGETISTHDYFLTHSNVGVIWGYEDGLWKVACRETCHQVLEKYPPLQAMQENSGYWVKYDEEPPSNAVSSDQFVGTWHVVRKSSDSWDNASAMLTVSASGSITLTGHPFALLPLGIEDSAPVSRFEVQSVDLVEESILQFDLTLYQEIAKTEADLWSELPPELIKEYEDLQKELTGGVELTEELLNRRGSYFNPNNFRQRLAQKKQEYRDMGYLIYPITTAYRYSRCVLHKSVKNYLGPWFSGREEPIMPDRPVTGLLPFAINSGFDLEKATYEYPALKVNSNSANHGENYARCEQKGAYYKEVPRFKRKYLPIVSRDASRIVVQAKGDVLLVLKRVNQ